MATQPATGRGNSPDAGAEDGDAKEDCEEYNEDFEEDDEPPMAIHRKLTVFAIQARGLPVADEFSSDPYLTVSIAGRKQRTRAVQASTEPRWDDQFEFELEEARCASGTLKLQMMDENFLKNDTHMCSAELPIYSLRGGPW